LPDVLDVYPLYLAGELRMRTEIVSDSADADTDLKQT
jgi:hypothetical protein